jgi:hypothetical protein
VFTLLQAAPSAVASDPVKGMSVSDQNARESADRYVRGVLSRCPHFRRGVSRRRRSSVYFPKCLLKNAAISSKTSFVSGAVSSRM